MNFQHTLRASAPAGTINPGAPVNGTIVNALDAERDGEPVRLVGFKPDFPKNASKVSRASSLAAFVGSDSEPFYIEADKLETFTYEPSITTTHDGGFSSPEESAVVMLEWLTAELTEGSPSIHVHVACDDGYTYSVLVTKDAEGKFVPEFEAVWKGGIK